MEKANKNNKKTNSKKDGFPTSALIVIVDVLLACLLVCGLFIDLYVVCDGFFEIGLLASDSVINLLTLVSSFLIPTRNNRILEKYSLSEENYDYLRRHTSGTYINLFIYSLCLIVIDAFLYVYSMSWSLIFAFIIEVLLIAIFVVPSFIQYVRGDDFIIQRSIKKITKQNQKADCYLSLTSAHFRLTNVKDNKNKNETLEEILGSILINNDVSNIFNLIYKKLKVRHNDKQNEILKFNLTEYLIYLISNYLDYIEPSIKTHLRDSKQVNLILNNRDVLESRINEDSKLGTFYLDNLLYHYLANIVFRLGNISSMYLEYQNSFDDVVNVIDKFDKNISIIDKGNIDNASICKMDYLLLYSIKEEQKWFLEKYPNHRVPIFADGVPHYYIAYIIYYFVYLNLVKEKDIAKGQKDSMYEKYLDIYKAIINDYSSVFRDLVLSIKPDEFYNLCRFLDNSSDNMFFISTSVKNGDFMIFIDLPSEDAVKFWFVLLLIRICLDEGFYDQMESTLDEKLEKYLFELAKSYIDQPEGFKNLIDSVIDLGFLNNKDISSLVSGFSEASQYILNSNQRRKHYKTLFKEKDITKLINNLNQQFEKDLDFINIDQSTTKTNVLSMPFIYCIDDNAAPIIKEYCIFPDDEVVRHYIFDIIQRDYETLNKGKKIRSYNSSVVEQIKDFQPDFFYMSDIYKRFLKLDKLKPVLDGLEEPNKYLNHNSHSSINVFYKQGAIKFYIKFSPEKSCMKPATNDFYDFFLNELRVDNRTNEVKNLTLEDFLKSVCRLELYVEYYFELDESKMLIYKPSLISGNDDD